MDNTENKHKYHKASRFLSIGRDSISVSHLHKRNHQKRLHPKNKNLKTKISGGVYIMQLLPSISKCHLGFLEKWHLVFILFYNKHVVESILS